MMRKFILFFIWISYSCFVYGQNLIPMPKKILHTSGSYLLNEKTTISTLNVNPFIYESLISTLNDENIKPILNDSRKKKSSNIHIEKLNSNSDLKNLLEKQNLDSNFHMGEEAYILDISSKRIQILALTDAGIYYGIQTLNQLINLYGSQGMIPNMSVYDQPDIAIRGWQDDISRGPIPTMEMLKEEIRIMSSFKLNYFTLYTEHVFKLEKHPLIAPEDGISKEQLIELSAFAKKHFVTLIGNYQSFGHMEKTLRLPEYHFMAENEHIISPVLDESYEFLSDVYEEIVPLYDSDYFNINCDETFGLGEGKSKKLVDSIGIAGVYALHINKLNDLLKNYDKKILMWGDIATSHPEIIPQLPQDMTVIVWGYHPAENFDYAITPISNQHLNFWVAPGVNCWSNVFPDMKSTEINVYNLIRDGYKLKATGVLNTSWDDDGTNFFNNNWHGFAWGAENSWNAPSNLSIKTSEKERISRYKTFNKAFDIQFYGLKNEEKSISELMLKFSALHQSNLRDILKNERFFEPIFPIHFDYIQKGEKEKNSSTLAELDSIMVQFKNLKSQVRRNKNNLDYLSFAIKQAQFTIEKNLYRIAVYNYLNEEDFSLTIIELKSKKHKLLQDLKSLKQDYVELWNRENRAYWLDQNESKFDELIRSLNTLDGYVLITPLNKVNENGRKISMRSIFKDKPIRYEINQDSVTSVSPIYSEPFCIKENSVILAASFDDTTQFPMQEMRLIYHKGIGKLYQLNSKYSTYHPSYDGGGMYALLDGKLGSADDLRSGKWQGYGGEDIDIELHFPKKERLNSFSMGFFQNTETWVIFPKQVEIYVKDELAQDYQLYKIIKGKTPPEEKGNLKENYTTDLEGIQPTYMKIIARYYGKLPAWHSAGSDYESMIFADEIIIE